MSANTRRRVEVVGSVLAILGGLALIMWAAASADESRMRIVVLAIFNAPILAISVTVPFIGSLRSALREKGPPGAIESTSYSRITGLFGAVVVTAFFWSIGNIVLWRLFVPEADVEGIIDGVWKFFMLGAALFLPYAFNQLRAIATDRQQHIVAMERLKLAPGVTTPGAPGTTVLQNKP